MITKFFSNSGKGGSSGVLDYMLGKDRNREAARIIKGNENITAALIDSINYARNYTSGCLSFSEKDISENIKEELMSSFEDTLLAGLNEEQRNILWIEHKDKGRLELNFIIPNVELKTGNRLQPFYSRADKGLVSAWQDIQNISNDFTDPNDPEKRRFLLMAHNTPKPIEEAKKSITEALMSLAENGIVKNRNDVVTAIKEAGFEVCRETNKSISIKNPDALEGRNIRLKGFIYERDFKLGTELQKELRERSESFKNSSRERLERAKREYESRLQTKSEYNKQRYDRLPRNDTEQNEQNIKGLAQQFESIRERAQREEPKNQKQSDYELGSDWSNFNIDNGDSAFNSNYISLESVVRLRGNEKNQHDSKRANRQNDLEQVRWETLRTNEPKLSKNAIRREGRNIYDRRPEGLNDDRETIINSIRNIANKSRDTDSKIDDFCNRTTKEFNDSIREAATRFNEFNHRATERNKEIARGNDSVQQHNKRSSNRVQQFIGRIAELYLSIKELLIKKNELEVARFYQQQIFEQKTKLGEVEKKNSSSFDR